jgi:hypothetical protein
LHPEPLKDPSAHFHNTMVKLLNSMTCTSLYVILGTVICCWPIPLAVRSMAWVCSSSLAGIVGLNPGWGMDVCLFECCVLSGRGLGFGLIPRPEESYRMCGVSQCDREASMMRRPWPTRVLLRHWKNLLLRNGLISCKGATSTK